MSNIIKVLQTTLRGSLSTTGTSFTVQKFVDSKGVEIAYADFNGNFVVVIEQGTQIEIIKCSGITQNGSDDTAVITVATNGRHLNPKSPWTGGSTGLQFTTGATVRVTNDPYTMSRLANLDHANTWALQQTFAVAPASSADAVSSEELVRKSQLDNAVLGTLSSAPLVVPATAGETVAVDQLVYLNTADQEWYLADADTASTVDNVVLGITRGAGTDGSAIANGVTLLGEHIAQSAIFTVGNVFASNTAGGFATSAGTTEVALGVASTTTKIYFNPRYSQQITENQQDLIQQIEAGTDWYAASSTGDDSYAITITPAITAYSAGMRFRFKTDVANTGAATLAVSGLSAIAIKKFHDQDLATGDIEAGQIVEVVYDGTNFQLVSALAQAASTVDVQVFDTSNTWSKPTGAKTVDVYVIGGGGGGGGGGRGNGGSTPDYGGGGGGGGGAYAYKRFLADGLSATETVTVGAGGAGGAGGASSSTGGSNGSAGGSSSFGTSTLLIANGGAAGNGGAVNGGNASGGSGGAARNGDIAQAGGDGAQGGSSSAGSAATSATTGVSPRGGGGGGHKGGSSDAAGGAGGGFTTNFVLAGGTAGASSGGAGGAGNDPSTKLIGGTGGGGGGSNGSATGAGGAGVAGSGGGGGGGDRNVAGSAGGAGGAGKVIVVSYT